MHLVANNTKYNLTEIIELCMYVKINYTSCWSYEGVAEVKVGEISEGIFHLDMCIIKIINKIPICQLLNPL